MQENDSGQVPMSHWWPLQVALSPTGGLVGPIETPLPKTLPAPSAVKCRLCLPAWPWPATSQLPLSEGDPVSALSLPVAGLWGMVPWEQMALATLSTVHSPHSPSPTAAEAWSLPSALQAAPASSALGFLRHWDLCSHGYSKGDPPLT